MRLLWPPPATTMSKRSFSGVCAAARAKGAAASGASAAVFTNPRRVMVFMVGLAFQSIPRNLSLVHNFFDRGAEILEHDGGGVAARTAGDRASRMRGGSGLVEPRDGHAMLRPAEHRAERTGLRRSGSSGVTTAVPVVRIHALKIE